MKLRRGLRLDAPGRSAGKVMSTATPPAGAVPRLLGVRAVAQMLGRSARHVYRLADAGRMPAPVEPGALVRWNQAAIEDWIAAGRPAGRRKGGE
jgi:excisionase family DNA binding protein